MILKHFGIIMKEYQITQQKALKHQDYNFKRAFMKCMKVIEAY